MRQVNQIQPVVVANSPEEPQEVRIEARETIHEAKVVAALEKYVADHRPEPMVSIALKTHRPVIESEKIILLVDNQLQLEKLEALKMHLQNILCKALNNGFLTFEYRLFDSNTTKEEKKLFTSSEKFEHFVKLNPVIADLKSIFGLELD